MSLIKSISGIRGTIGGEQGNGLTPPDIVKFTSAYASFIKESHPGEKITVVIGRDARLSGKMVNDLVSGTLVGMGINVLDVGLSTTPTVEMAVTDAGAQGGIIITASHNPKQWNALKLLNNKGEFLSASEGELIVKKSDDPAIHYTQVTELGSYTADDSHLKKHIQKILSLPLVDSKAIEAANFTVGIDAVNSTGGIAIPMLLEALGVKNIETIYCDPTGDFPHNPEPLPEHLRDICELVSRKKADVGFVVDPDVDRLAIITELGEPFGEEYTLVAVSDYILKNKVGNTVSNLSSSMALRKVTEKAGGQYFAAAVGEVNVVAEMKLRNAVIGGEGNGGVIYPELHYGRDALVGVALFLTYLAKTGMKCSVLRDTYPYYYISKNKVEFSLEMDIDEILGRLMKKYEKMPITTIDGVKIHFGDEWVHMRRSNTEPIVRIYAESDLMEKAENLAKKILNDFKEILKDTGKE
jgi:phosphomannomutase